MAGAVTAFFKAAVTFFTTNAVGKFIATAVGTFLLDTAVRKLFGKDLDLQDADRNVMVRGTQEPRRIIYGQAATSGPLMFLGTSGTDNKELYFGIALAAHECESYVSVLYDNDEIALADISDINASPAGDGLVNAGTFANIAYARVHLGSDTQAADSMLTSKFSLLWTSNHRGRGITYIISRHDLIDGSTTPYEAGPPSNIRVVLKGKRVYDPRKDSTQTDIPGSGSHRVNDPTTWEWSDTPPLCVADYLIDTKNGPGWSTDQIDYVGLADEADYCEELVDVPPAASPANTEKRFTCNGVLFTTEDYGVNVENLLSSMNGRMYKRNGKWRIKAGRYVAPDSSLAINEDWLRGGMEIETGPQGDARYNTVRASYFDEERQHQVTSMLEVTNSGYVSRDNGEKKYRTLSLPMTKSETEAQRLAFQILHQSNNLKTVVYPANYRGTKIPIGETLTVDDSELSWSGKVFRCVGHKIGEFSGVDLVLREETSTAYADPAVGDYGTRSITGTLEFPASGVPVPTGLTATGLPGGILLKWTNPTPASMWDRIDIYAADTDQWDDGASPATVLAVKVGETTGTEFFHRLGPNVTKYYWIRAVNKYDTESLREPDNDTTTVSATAEEFKETIGLTDPTFDKTDPDASPHDSTYWTFSVTSIGNADFINNGGENDSHACRLYCPGENEQAWLITNDRIVIAASSTFQIRLRLKVDDFTANGAGDKPSIYVGARYYADLQSAAQDTGTTVMVRKTTEDLVISSPAGYFDLYVSFPTKQLLDAGTAKFVSPLVLLATPADPSPAVAPEATADVTIDTFELWWITARDIAQTERTVAADIQDPSIDVLYLPRYAAPNATDFADALEDADAVGGAIVPFRDDAYNIGEASPPPSISLTNPIMFFPGAELEIQSGAQLSLGHIYAPLQTILSGLGTPKVHAAQMLSPRYFGGGAAGMLAAIAAVKGSAGWSEIVLDEKEYLLTSTTGNLTLDANEDAANASPMVEQHQGIVIRAVGGPATRLQDGVGGVRIKADSTLDPDEHVIHLLGVQRSNGQASRADFRLYDIDIDGNQAARGSGTGDGVHCEWVKDVLLHGLRIHEAPQDGLGGTGTSNQVHIGGLSEYYSNVRDGWNQTQFGDCSFEKLVTQNNGRRGVNMQGGNLYGGHLHTFSNAERGFAGGGNGVKQIASIRTTDNDEDGGTVGNGVFYFGAYFGRNNGKSTASPDVGNSVRTGLRATNSPFLYVGHMHFEDSGPDQSPAVAATQEFGFRHDQSGGYVRVGLLTSDGNMGTSEHAGSGVVHWGATVDDYPRVIGDDEDATETFVSASSRIEYDLASGIEFRFTFGATILARWIADGATGPVYHDAAGTNRLQMQSSFGATFTGRFDVEGGDLRLDHEQGVATFDGTGTIRFVLGYVAGGVFEVGQMIEPTHIRTSDLDDTKVNDGSNARQIAYLDHPSQTFSATATISGAWNFTTVLTVNGVDVVHNINSLSVAAGIDASSDYLPIYDASATGNRKILIEDLPFAETGAAETISASWTINADMTFGNSVKAIFGASANSSIEWDNSNQRLLVTIQAADEFRVQKNTGELIFRGIADGASYGYYNGNVRWSALSASVDFAVDIDVAGDITLTGTVDGRDVATDGTKLDGIESGAEVNPDIATQAEAEAGSNNTDMMTSLRVRQAIEAYLGTSDVCITGNNTYNAGTISPGSSLTDTVTVSGADAGRPIANGVNTTDAADLIPYAFISSANTVKFRLYNIDQSSPGTVNPGAVNWDYIIFQGSF